MNTAADCACSAKRELAFELASEILRARVDGSDMTSFDGVVLGSFVAQVRGIRHYDFGVSGVCRGESVVVGRRPDNVQDVNCLDVTLFGVDIFCAVLLANVVCVVCSLCGTAGCQLRNTPIHLLCTTLTSYKLGNLN